MIRLTPQQAVFYALTDRVASTEPVFPYTMDFSLSEFGYRVRSLRRAQGLTQEQLAEAADLNTRTIQKIEAGKLSIMLTTMARLQAALSCTAGDLLDSGPLIIQHDSIKQTRPSSNHSSDGNQNHDG